MLQLCSARSQPGAHRIREVWMASWWCSPACLLRVKLAQESVWSDSTHKNNIETLLATYCSQMALEWEWVNTSATAVKINVQSYVSTLSGKTNNLSYVNNGSVTENVGTYADENFL